MKAVLLSVSPKNCELIASGKKTIEVRKTKPKLETPFKCYIYCTFDHYKAGKKVYSLYMHRGTEKRYLANGKVIGEFVCDKIFELHYRNGDCFSHYDTNIMESACLSLNDIHEYGKGKTLYGWHISDLKIYDKPKELSEFWTAKCVNKKAKSCGECDIVGCVKRIKIPFQSWGYVEEL